jgi:hypothetical protein
MPERKPPKLVLDVDHMGKKKGEEVKDGDPGWDVRWTLIGLKMAHWEYDDPKAAARSLRAGV